MDVVRSLLLLAGLLGCGGIAKAPSITCESAGCDPAATCTVTNRLAVCSCPANYDDVNGDGTSCVDHDECADGLCSPNAVCTNKPGTFACECKKGFNGDGIICNDVDECAFNSGCSSNATCTNLPGTFACACKPGFTGDGINCADIDECSLGTAGCSPYAACANTPGAFTCQCKPGFQGNGFSCVDVDECALKTADCGWNVPCINTPGSYTCGACPQGYSGGGAAGCLDIDECSAYNGGCSENATCTNWPGSFTCDCKPGYDGNGFTCYDVDACANHDCGQGYRCVDLPPPAPDSEEGRMCLDVDECAVGNGGCAPNAVCENEAGGKTCTCKDGYVGNGFTCTDVDECAKDNGGCSTYATCLNTEGGRQCTCQGGYEGDGIVCTDVNECKEGNGGCGENAVCRNTIGSRTCSCKEGYQGNGYVCKPATCATLTCASDEICQADACQKLPLSVSAVWDRVGPGDLWVRTPNNMLISFLNPEPGPFTDFGQLDRDSDAFGPERIFWAPGTYPPVGTYHVCFNAYLAPDLSRYFSPTPSEDNPVRFTVTISIPGLPEQVVHGSRTFDSSLENCSPETPTFVASFTYGSAD
jgi:hypothetical protein